MKIDTYQSSKKFSKFLCVPAGTDLSRFPLPLHVDGDLREVRIFKRNREVRAGKQYIGVSGDEIVEQIERNGYATFSGKVTVTEKKG